MLKSTVGHYGPTRKMFECLKPFNSFCFETLSFFPFVSFFSFCFAQNGGYMAPRLSRCRRPCAISRNYFPYDYFLTVVIWIVNDIQ